MPVITGAASYPSDILEKLAAKGASIDAFDALALAEEAGSSKAVNIALLGRLARYLDIPYEKWTEAIAKTVAEKFVSINEKAFSLGYRSE